MVRDVERQTVNAADGATASLEVGAVVGEDACEEKDTVSKLPCVSCGELTEWRCADCGIGSHLHPDHPQISVRRTVAVCHKTSCRDQHERAEARQAREI